MNVPVLIDGAQGIQHGVVDVREMDCDFYVFSGHKIYGPTGIGCLYGKEKWLSELPPFQGGGDMVDKVTFEKTTYNELPFKFEAGTTNYPGGDRPGCRSGLCEQISEGLILKYVRKNSSLCNRKALGYKGPEDLWTILQAKIPTISFLLDGIHQYDTGMILDKMGIAVRTGTHCAQPVMERYGIEGTVRASICFYNTKEEIDSLAEGIEKVISMFA